METKRAHIYKGNYEIICIDYDCYFKDETSNSFIFTLKGETTAIVPFSYLIVF